MLKLNYVSSSEGLVSISAVSEDKDKLIQRMKDDWSDEEGEVVFLKSQTMNQWTLLIDEEEWGTYWIDGVDYLK